jgi:small subunit ribosomal protein S4
MTKRNNAKYKISRRFGINLWGRAKDPSERRAYVPGQHGLTTGKRISSDFGTQLKAKQILKGYYGNISEKQFRNTFAEAENKKGDTGENLINFLERRLDAVIYRMNFVPTVFAARQIVSHKHILVNGKKVNIASYRVSDGDVIEVKESSKTVPVIMEATDKAEREIPGYLEVDLQAKKGRFLRTPSMEEVPYPVKMDVNLVIEFYSR